MEERDYKTVTEIINEVIEDMCSHYCKHPFEQTDQDKLDEICDECPLNRL